MSNELEFDKQNLPTTNKFIPGLEGVDQDLLIIPRLKLVQKNSVEVDNGVKPGSVVNSMTKDVIAEPGKDGAELVVIPVLNSRSRILFGDYDNSEGILCSAQDAKIGSGDPGGECLHCPKATWIRSEKGTTPPPCTEFINVYVAVRGYNIPIPLVGSFGKTSFGAGKQLINFFYMDSRIHQKSPWNFAYTLRTKYVTSGKLSWYVFNVAPAGKATDGEVATGDLFYNLLKTTKAVIHEDEEEVKQEQSKAGFEKPDSEPDF